MRHRHLKDALTAMRHYSFKPSFISLILMLAGLTLFVRLGVWQLDRAAERDAINHDREQRAMAPVLNVESPETVDLSALRYSSVRLLGEYDLAHEFLLDNQPEAGVVGFHVLTPFRVKGSDLAVIINRGWIPLGPDRLHPVIPAPAPEGPVTVFGLIDDLYRVGLKLEGADVPGAGWPSLVQVPDVAQMSARLRYPLGAYQVLLSPQTEGGFKRSFHTRRLDADKNRGYALQWFLLAALVLFLFVRHGLKRSST